MKSIKSLSAIALACALALCLFACAGQVEEKEQAAQTSLAVAQSDPLAYLNALIPMLLDAEGFVAEAAYGMDDIEIGNDTLKAARDVVKGYVTSYLSSSFTKEKESFYRTEKESLSKKSKERVQEDLGAECPALFHALQAQDLLEGLVVSEVLELRVAERLANLETELADGRNTAMKGKSAEEKRAYVLEQMGESAVNDARRQYQIEGMLSLGAIERLFPAVDKADILAQLAKSGEYLVVEGYAVEPTELKLFATVVKAYVDADQLAAQQVTDPALAQDHIRELTFTQKAGLTADAAGAGAFADAGEFPISLTLTKTLKFKDIVWEVQTDETA
ncbi:MAG: hypothetical protein LBB75_08975 [Oscillospiraceae bacterium]|jgi:hypothetical protein|nr:hypothetical protein [Oscillospiraceae bacterium]